MTEHDLDFPELEGLFDDQTHQEKDDFPEPDFPLSEEQLLNYISLRSDYDQDDIIGLAFVHDLPQKHIDMVLLTERGFKESQDPELKSKYQKLFDMVSGHGEIKSLPLSDFLEDNIFVGDAIDLPHIYKNLDSPAIGSRRRVLVLYTRPSCYLTHTALLQIVERRHSTE